MTELTKEEKKFVAYALMWSAVRVEDKDTDVTLRACVRVAKKIGCYKELMESAKKIIKFKDYIR